LREVLTRFRQEGLTLRREKCHLGQSKVKWFGMVYTKHGMSDDPEKTAVIRNWTAPQTVRDVKSFIQNCQFNSVYMAAEEAWEMNYPELTALLRALTKRKVRLPPETFYIDKSKIVFWQSMVPYDLTRQTRLYSDGGPQGAQATVAQ
jgi:hypothetical protein